ncbi:MAG: hypothetical protein FWG15_03750 [Propionibacteriaceae bacterium]|nr:hypothetical protein [Propionibacteriaceae bacterium]
MECAVIAKELRSYDGAGHHIYSLLLVSVLGTPYGNRGSHLVDPWAAQG